MKKFLLVKLHPKDMRCQNETIHLGAEIIARTIREEGWQLDIKNHREYIDNVYDYEL